MHGHDRDAKGEPEVPWETTHRLVLIRDELTSSLVTEWKLGPGKEIEDIYDMDKVTEWLYTEDIIADPLDEEVTDDHPDE
jgi:hypothetical protein